MSDVTSQTVVESGKVFAKEVFYLSIKLVEGLSSLFSKAGLPLDDTQLKILIAIIDLGLIYLVLFVLKNLKKPVKFIIIILLIYLFVGFWL